MLGLAESCPLCGWSSCAGFYCFADSFKIANVSVDWDCDFGVKIGFLASSFCFCVYFDGIFGILLVLSVMV